MVELFSYGPLGWGDEILAGLWVTMRLALVTLPVGLLLGFAVAALSLSRLPLLRALGAGYTTLMRGLPEILVVLFIYFGTSQALFLLGDGVNAVCAVVATGQSWCQANWGYVEMSPFWCGVVALSLLFASYATQTLRAALKAVPKGQRQAAQALGLPAALTFRRIVLPQAWRHALPGLGNQWLVLLKDTALVSLIGVNEMMRQAQMASASTYQPFTWYAAAALIYLAISLVSEFGLKLAARYTRRYGG